MLDHPLSTLLLGPILVAQGAYARRFTPKLPEPAGARAGTQGRGPALNLLIAGDSAAAGVGANHQNAALSGRLVDTLSDTYSVRWQLCATTGHAANDALTRLKQQPAHPVDVALISLGVNDVTSPNRVKPWIEQMRQLNQLIHDRFGCRVTIFTAVPPMHQFPALPQPLRWYLGRKARLFNQHLSHLATPAHTSPITQVLAIPFPLTPQYIAQDGFHPSESAYQLWANQAASLIRTLIDESAAHTSNVE